MFRFRGPGVSGFVSVEMFPRLGPGMLVLSLVQCAILKRLSFIQNLGVLFRGVRISTLNSKETTGGEFRVHRASRRLL